MRLVQLRIENLRNLATVELEPSPGINLFVGANGAGKTSVLEAVYLLAHAQSFRSGRHESLARLSGGDLSVFAQLMRHGGALRRLGLRREASRWVSRVDGATPASISELLTESAAVCFEPGSHSLVSGASELRRRFLDWSVFHVEPDYFSAARSYRRALKQRNTVLRGTCDGPQLAPWSNELVRWGDRLERSRSDYLAEWRTGVVDQALCFLPELGVCRVDYQRGWKADATLQEALFAGLAGDMERGHTRVGPHRADWSIEFELAPGKAYLSRGQEKLCALACVMAQAKVHANRCGEWPLVCLDDLASELDADHQAVVVTWLQESGAQVFVTGTEIPPALADTPHTLFHVEQGRVSRLL